MSLRSVSDTVTVVPPDMVMRELDEEESDDRSDDELPAAPSFRASPPRSSCISVVVLPQTTHIPSSTAGWRQGTM